MLAKTFGTIVIIFICLLMLPVGIGIIGGIFGVIFGVVGAVFGALFGIIGGIFGAIFGFFGWLFEALFGWGDWDFHGPFGFVDCGDVFTWMLIIVVVALLVKSKRPA